MLTDNCCFVGAHVKPVPGQIVKSGGIHATPIPDAMPTGSTCPTTLTQWWADGGAAGPALRDCCADEYFSWAVFQLIFFAT